MFDIAFSLVEKIDLFGIDIEACHRKSLLVKFDDERQTHISEAYYADCGSSFTDSF